MSSTRARYQRGTVEDHAGKLYFRYRDTDRVRRSVFLGTTKELSTAAKLNRAVDQVRLRANTLAGPPTDRGMLMAELAERYKAERLPKRPSTRRAYLGKLHLHVLPRWGNVTVAEMMNSAYAVENWLKDMKAAPKSKVHIRGMLSILLDHAMRTGVVPLGRNPMELVRVEGASRRKKEPRILTYEEFAALLAELSDPYRPMAILAGCLGLRCSEILGLKWSDIDFDGLKISLKRAVVNTDEDLKTVGSKSVLPISVEVADVLSRWKSETFFKGPDDWVFASPYKAGRMPYHGWSAQYWTLAPAGRRAGIGNIGWHDLRHSYRVWLDEAGTPVGVQKDCLRHSAISTTMNIYGSAQIAAKREAHGKVVQMLKKTAGGL